MRLIKHIIHNGKPAGRVYAPLHDRVIDFQETEQICVGVQDDCYKSNGCLDNCKISY